MLEKKVKHRIGFSIIVPVYNVEKYLPQCIENVLSQTIENFEVILVDDGSPDGCRNICDQYALRDKRIKTIHKENGGLSSARNAGLDMATGKYVIFLDSDDFWDDCRALEEIGKRLDETQADVLIFPAKRYYEADGSHTNILNMNVERSRVMDKELDSAIIYLLENNIYRAAAWNKVIRRKLIEEHSMRFKEGYLSEDMDWCGDLLLYAKRFDFYDIPFYCYRQQRSGSITSEKNEKLVADKLYMCKKGLKQSKELEPDKGRLLASYYAYEYSVALGLSFSIRNRELLEQMKALQELLKYDISNKVKSVNKLKKLGGYELTRMALCFYCKIKR